MGDVIYFNNPNGVPQYYSNTTAQFENLPYWSSTWTCRSLRAFGDFLVAFNVTKSGVNYANLVKTSDATLYGQPPGSWNQDDQTTLATENPLEQLTSPIVDGCCLGNAMIIYTSDQIWLMQQSGNQLVFQYTQIFSEGGIIAPNCAVEVNGQHYVFGINDIYTHDGSTKQSIATQRVRTFIFQNLNIKESERCFVAHMPFYNEILFAFPSSDIYAYWQTPSAGCNRGALYNYIQNTWSFIDLPCVMAWSRANVQTEYTFETVPAMDTFGNTGGSFYDLIDGYQKFEICVNQPASGSISTSNLLAYDFLDKGQLSFPYLSNVNAPAFIEKIGIDLDQMGGDLTTYKIVKRVYPQVLLFNTSSPVYFYVQVGAQDYPSSSVKYDLVSTFNPAIQYKCDMRVGSRYFAIRFTLSADADFEIAGFDLDVISNGKR